ncbi:Transmembrane and TPR repeat-containing protein CG4341 [Camponotus floridanus]|uniref:Transmembrane and TPR repeat-containing protein CG4341 n=1 Tax=Camponotus floridanus TaxID=104421 RepID=E2B0N8_CAMFO|nr:Transmembrane and TPR repeat-containing protein CG4341 [Camponotus floridanus]
MSRHANIFLLLPEICGLVYVHGITSLASVYNLLGETLSRLQQYAEAERWFQASLASQPDHVPAHITYGKLLARNSSRVLEAERWFLRARRLAPDDPSVHHHYGLFLTSQGRLVEAAEEQLRAAELSRSDYELSVAAASALRQADRRDEAEVWYRHAANLRPHEARSHTNLGAILHLNGKYKQAAAAYREALRLQPGDATTITNLHKLAAILA